MTNKKIINISLSNYCQKSFWEIWLNFFINGNVLLFYFVLWSCEWGLGYIKLTLFSITICLFFCCFFFKVYSGFMGCSNCKFKNYIMKLCKPRKLSFVLHLCNLKLYILVSCQHAHLTWLHEQSSIKSSLECVFTTVQTFPLVFISLCKLENHKDQKTVALSLPLV